jgi:hypothetical protein
MGYELRRRLREVLGPDIAGLQRAVALEIADDARDETRMSMASLDDLARWTAAKDAGVIRNALKRLAGAGWEFRVPLGIGKDGRLLYAVPGKRLTFRVPDFEGGAGALPYAPKGEPRLPIGGAPAPCEGAPAPPFSSYPSLTPQRESARTSTSRPTSPPAAAALSLIPSDWQPGPDDIHAAQQARTAAGWPVLTGAELTRVTHKFVRRQRDDHRALPSGAWSGRWRDWAERERPTGPPQPAMLGLLDGGRSDGLWPHEQPTQPPGTPKPPSLAVRMAQLDAAIAADQHTDTA